MGSLEHSRSKTANRGGKVIISHWSGQGQWDLFPHWQERNYGADCDRTRNVSTKFSDSNVLRSWLVRKEGRACNYKSQLKLHACSSPCFRPCLSKHGFSAVYKIAAVLAPLAHPIKAHRRFRPQTMLRNDPSSSSYILFHAIIALWRGYSSGSSSKMCHIFAA